MSSKVFYLSRICYGQVFFRKRTFTRANSRKLVELTNFANFTYQVLPDYMMHVAPKLHLSHFNLLLIQKNKINLTITI